MPFRAFLFSLSSLLIYTSLVFGENNMSSINITSATLQPSMVGNNNQFTGSVRVDSLFQAPNPARVGGALVTFEPSARTNWHTHPLGQTLFVTQGTGWIQEWGKEKQLIKQGDIVWIPEKIKHWHGASKETAMVHFAIAEAKNGGAVEWLEAVSDEQFLQ